jgi:Xaa-Pro aminopeptidase
MTAVAGLPPCATAARLGRLLDALEPAGCDALVVTNLRNVRYLTGFHGSAGVLVVSRAGARLLTDGRYETQAPADLAAAGVDTVQVAITSESGPGARPAKEVFLDAVLAAAEAGARAAGRGGDTGVTGTCRVGLESTSVTWADQRRYLSWLETMGDRAVLVPTDGVVEQLRAVKDPGEVARIETAAGIADAALAEVAHLLTTGVSEVAFGAELDAAMRRLGAAERSFETIVASGPNSARPHARPTDRRVERGDLVVIDFGATVDGYRSDMTRTLLVGPGSAAQRELLEVVRAAQAAGAAAVGPGVPCSEIDRACRSVIEAAGLGDRFVHGTGHGVGLDIHEAPWVNSRSAATLAPGHVVTVEPGVYLPSVGGVRVEDTVLVTDTGARPLTRAPKDPFLA